MKKLLSLIFIMTLLFTGCTVDKTQDIQISGSSTVYPITLEAQSKFLDEVNPNARITVESSGTGGGLELFTQGEVQIANASRAIKEEEKEVAKENNIDYTEYQIGVDGITVIINPENDWAKNMTSEELKKAFEMGSDVNTWSDINPDYPDEPIRFYGPTSASGTYDFFVEEIIGDDEGALRDDMNATENDNEIITNIQKDKYGIGFLGYSFYSANKDTVQEVSIDGVDPAPESIKNGEYILSRPLFIYVNNKDMKENKILNDFVTYYIENCQYFVELSGYIPLTDVEQAALEEKL